MADPSSNLPEVSFSIGLRDYVNFIDFDYVEYIEYLRSANVSEEDYLSRPIHFLAGSQNGNPYNAAYSSLRRSMDITITGRSDEDIVNAVFRHEMRHFSEDATKTMGFLSVFLTGCTAIANKSRFPMAGTGIICEAVGIVENQAFIRAIGVDFLIAAAGSWAVGALFYRINPAERSARENEEGELSVIKLDPVK